MPSKTKDRTENAAIVAVPFGVGDTRQHRWQNTGFGTEVSTVEHFLSVQRDFPPDLVAVRALDEHRGSVLRGVAMRHCVPCRSDGFMHINTEDI